MWLLQTALTGLRRNVETWWAYDKKNSEKCQQFPFQFQLCTQTLCPTHNHFSWRLNLMFCVRSQICLRCFNIGYRILLECVAGGIASRILLTCPWITDLYRNLMLHGIPSGNVPTWHSFAPHCSPLRKIFVTNKFQSIWKTVFNYELQKNQLDEGGLSVKGELRACYLICCLFVGHETALRVTHTLTNTHPSAGRQRLKRLCKFSWALYKH